MRLLVVLTLLLGFMACSECEECDTAIGPPSASFFFIDGQLVKNLSDSASQATEVIALLDNEIDTLQTQTQIWSDSLSALSVLLDSGFIEFQTDSVAVAEIILQNNQQINLLSEQRDSVSLVLSTIEVKKTSAENGEIVLDTVRNLSNQQFLSFTDTASNFILPLEIAASTSYSFSIDGGSYQLNLGYDLLQEQNIEREIVIRAANLAALSFNFDSVLVVCGSNECVNNETDIICYF